MNFVFKALFTVLLSSSAYAATTTMNQLQMNESIQKLKAEIASECGANASQDVLAGLVSNKCPKKSEDYLKTNFCNRKKDLVLFFEGVMSKSNVSDVSRRFGEVPPAEALGSVLLYQMRNSIDQVNETWSSQLKRVSSACATLNMKKQFSKYTNTIREDFKKTTLLVNPPAG